jgi:hypothetical protein
MRCLKNGSVRIEPTDITTIDQIDPEQLRAIDQRGVYEGRDVRVFRYQLHGHYWHNATIWLDTGRIAVENGADSSWRDFGGDPDDLHTVIVAICDTLNEGDD